MRNLFPYTFAQVRKAAANVATLAAMVATDQLVHGTAQRVALAVEAVAGAVAHFAVPQDPNGPAAAGGITVDAAHPLVTGTATDPAQAVPATQADVIASGGGSGSTSGPAEPPDGSATYVDPHDLPTPPGPVLTPGQGATS